MKATELRLGNLVKNQKGVAEPIQGIYTIPDYIELLTETHVGLADDFTPIPLTEEWLERFGFELDYEGDYILAWRGVVLYFRLSDMSLRRDYKQKNKLSIIPIDYVHQLQNLYFALTGEELTLIK